MPLPGSPLTSSRTALAPPAVARRAAALALRLASLLAPTLLAASAVGAHAAQEPAQPSASSESAQGQASELPRAHGLDATGVPRRGPAPVDPFHPARARELERGLPPPEPAYGGTLSMQLELLPASLNLALENTTNTELVSRAVHETLRRLDPERWELVDVLLAARFVEERLELVDGTTLFGAVEEQEGSLLVRPLSPFNPLREARTLALAEVAARHPATVYTYVLRDDVEWQPSAGFAHHRFDARDVSFSASLYANPHVRCDEKRYAFRELVGNELLDQRTVRFTFAKVDFRGDEALTSMPLLPSHLYDLSDPDNPEAEPDAGARRQGEYVNANPHNRLWVGLGPWRVTTFDERQIVAERFAGYFDPARAGWFDRVRWVLVPDAQVVTALLEGVIDFSARVPADDFFGAATRSRTFEERFVRGWFYLGRYAAIVWNTRRPQLADPRVRRALARSFDFERVLAATYHGLGLQVSGPMPCFSPAYDETLEPYAYDPPRAARELAEAGWYDRDGDGLIDHDGLPLRLEYVMPAGHATSRALGLHLQEELARLGIALSIREVEGTSYRERQRTRDFDAIPIGFTLPLELDPAQAFGSAAGAPGVESSNYAGLQDEQVDALIARGRVELDFDARMRTWRALQRRLYELQPYLFLWNVPVKFALARRVRGFQAFALDPGYSIRRWYLPRGTPGTRSERVPEAPDARSERVPEAPDARSERVPETPDARDQRVPEAPPREGR